MCDVAWRDKAIRSYKYVAPPALKTSPNRWKHRPGIAHNHHLNNQSQTSACVFSSHEIAHAPYLFPDKRNPSTSIPLRIKIRVLIHR